MAKLAKLALVLGLVAALLLLGGCASVPMAPKEQDALRKAFPVPSDGMSGIYIFRDSSFGAALKKTIYIDKKPIGETAPNTYFYHEVAAGQHTLSTESEFSENDLKIDTVIGRNRSGLKKLDTRLSGKAARQ